MPSFKLNSTTGDQSIAIPPDRPLIVGRAVTSDLPVYDPTVSRKHAEIAATPGGASVKDLGSSNGQHLPSIGLDRLSGERQEAPERT